VGIHAIQQNNIRLEEAREKKVFKIIIVPFSL